MTTASPLPKVDVSPAPKVAAMAIHIRHDFSRHSRLQNRMPPAFLKNTAPASKRQTTPAEDAVRFALDAARAGTWDVDFATGCVNWSDTLESLHGLRPGTFAGTLRAFLEAVHPDDREQVREALERAMRDRTDPHIQYRTAWSDGSIHRISTIGRIFYDESGAPMRAAGVALDVTERTELEERHRQSQKMEAIGQLAGGIAHDFNNLLTAIHGYSEMLTEALEPDCPHLSDVREIRRAADRATALTRQLLAFSRNQILEPRILDLRESLQSMEAMLSRLIGEDIEVVVRTASDAGHVKADPGQVEQVILNLALNARDAMPKGGTMIIELSNAELDAAYARRHAGASPGRYVQLSVSDTGTGMDSATIARIFDPFFTTKAHGRGTGLGLSTVYGIVKQSGGNIWVYSEPGRGSTFKVYLPRIDEPADRPCGETLSASIRGAETVLVVEDEHAVRELVRKVLERSGYRVLVASTPHEALQIISQGGHAIHLLMSDVVLPQMGGRALAEQITAQLPDVRVLYMSGYTDDAIVHHGVLDPGTPFLQKPFTARALTKKVREVLQ
jgi:two-component system cell cycle sensor histidine kinase/response regulator CckA